LRVCGFVTDSAQAATYVGEINAGETEIYFTDLLILRVSTRCSELRSAGKTHFQMCKCLAFPWFRLKAIDIRLVKFGLLGASPLQRLN
jgi:hypothetical protein